MPLEVSSDVKPLIKMRLGPRAFSKDCTENSDISLSCEMKDVHAFKIARKSDFLLSQGIPVSTAREAAISGSLSHTEC